MFDKVDKNLVPSISFRSRREVQVIIFDVEVRRFPHLVNTLN